MTSEWDRLTWLELRERAKEDPVVLVPLGCVETQGPYSPLGLERILADRLSRDVAIMTGSLTLPVMPFGNSGMFASVPGTIFIQPDTLTAVFRDILQSVIRSGFSRILCLAFHIPNQPLLEQAARLIRDETGIMVGWVNPGALAATYLPDLFDDPAAARGHGAEPGGSLMRFLADTSFPTIAPAEELPRDIGPFTVRGAAVFHEQVPVGLPIDWPDLYPQTGGYGDPTLGSREIGETMYRRLVEDISGVVGAFAEFQAGQSTARS